MTARGFTEIERGRGDAALPDLEMALSIRKSLLPDIHVENANSIGNVASAYMQTLRKGSAEKAVAMFFDALRINHEVCKVNPTEGNRLLHIRHLNLARALRVAGRFQEAFHHVEEARRYSVETFGPGGHYEASWVPLFLLL